MKKLQYLVGTKVLSKKELQSVKGGQTTCAVANDCDDIPEWECWNGRCRLIKTSDTSF